jgi:quercetin dioxygenase-like cupin family protein
MATEHSKSAICGRAGEMLTFKVADEIARLKSTSEWKSGDRHAINLVKNAPLNMLLMVLKKGARLHEHRTKGPLVLQVLSGAIRFTAGTEQPVSAGEMLALDRNIVHEVEALEESAIIIFTAIN